MTNQQWNTLLEVLDGKQFKPFPSGFIIDSPWLPGWNGISAMDYYSSEKLWLKSNFNAIDTFPEIMFLPGFWSEFGMCTEPSAFGSKMVWDEMELPHADKVIHSTEMIDELKKPNVEKDGLLPFMIKRLLNSQTEINEKGHSIKFAVARGPLNIATFLMGTTEFMLALMMEPERIHKFLTTISDFISDWLKHQIKMFPSIEGIFVLDDIVGFLGDDDIQKFVVPYLKNIYDQFDVPVKFFHNDAEGKVCAPYLEEIGINLFNYSFTHSIKEMRELCGEKVTLLGNIPPRDVLAKGTSTDVANAVVSSIEGVTDRKRIIMSCGGGMPPKVKSENIKAFVNAVQECS